MIFKRKSSLVFFAIILSIQFLSAQTKIENDTIKKDELKEVKVIAKSRAKNVSEDTIKIEVLDVKELQNSSTTLGAVSYHI